jgi:iron complex outermembrane recepter protein
LLRFEDPAYTLYDASAGIAKDAWTVEFYGQNLTNSNASIFTSTTQFVPAEVITRPRVLGVKIGYKF